LAATLSTAFSNDERYVPLFNSCSLSTSERLWL
jgi:hypothetical protein